MLAFKNDKYFHPHVHMCNELFCLDCFVMFSNQIQKYFYKVLVETFFLIDT
jgi:hypothetical protein